MVPLIIPTTVFPGVSRLASPLPNSIVKPHRTAGNRSGEYRPNPKAINAFFCPAPRNMVPTTLKSRLAAAGSTSASETEINGEKREMEEAEVVIIPKHVAIIMDGNGRWAQNRGLTVQDGHQKGIINLEHLTTTIASNSTLAGIKLLSVYAFSSQNWTRSQIEVECLMRIFHKFIRSTLPTLMTQHDLRFSAIGNKSRLPEYLQSAISSAEEMSAGNKGLHLVMALSYGGRDDIVHATRMIAKKVEKGILQATEVDEAMLNHEMMTSNLQFPDPDLIIRTSGELRISNFLLWQSAYTELYFTDTLFPDFGLDHLREALTSYQSRKRRYGQRN